MKGRRECPMTDDSGDDVQMSRAQAFQVEGIASTKTLKWKSALMCWRNSREASVAQKS